MANTNLKKHLKCPLVYCTPPQGRISTPIKSHTSPLDTSICPYPTVPHWYLNTCSTQLNVTISTHHELDQGSLNKATIKDPIHYLYILGSTKSKSERNSYSSLKFIITSISSNFPRTIFRFTENVKYKNS